MRLRDWQLRVLAGGASGGSIEQAIPAAAAIACFRISIILVDDLFDADPRGEHHRVGAPATANLAIAFHALALDAIARSNAKRETKLAVLCRLNQMMLTTAFGQYLDVQGPKEEEDYWQMVPTKSSPFFCSVLYVGALMGSAAREDALQIERFGNLYGEMIQIHDDLNDTMAVPANPDWRLDRSPFPILFAQVVEYAEKERFLELCQNISDPVALTEAQTILICCGASATVLTNCCADIKRLKRAWMRSCYPGGKDSKIYSMALLNQ